MAQIPTLRFVILKLLPRNIIREILTYFQAPLFFSRLFLVRKKDNSFHPILDLSHISKFLVVSYFKMELVQSIAQAIVEPLWECVLDL